MAGCFPKDVNEFLDSPLDSKPRRGSIAFNLMGRDYVFDLKVYPEEISEIRGSEDLKDLNTNSTAKLTGCLVYPLTSYAR